MSVPGPAIRSSGYSRGTRSTLSDQIVPPAAIWYGVGLTRSGNGREATIRTSGMTRAAPVALDAEIAGWPIGEVAHVSLLYHVASAGRGVGQWVIGLSTPRLMTSDTCLHLAWEELWPR